MEKIFCHFYFDTSQQLVEEAINIWIKRDWWVNSKKTVAGFVVDEDARELNCGGINSIKFVCLLGWKIPEHVLCPMFENEIIFYGLCFSVWHFSNIRYCCFYYIMWYCHYWRLQVWQEWRWEMRESSEWTDWPHLRSLLCSVSGESPPLSSLHLTSLQLTGPHWTRQIFSYNCRVEL